MYLRHHRGRCIRTFLIGAFSAVALAACEDRSEPDRAMGREASRAFDTDQLRRGEAIYAANCAECHGRRGEGAPNWQQRGPNGAYPAPPLNGTGHTWHHTKAGLVLVIRKGTERIGGGMPAWEGKLTSRDIEDVLAYLQSLWPQEVYDAWVKIDQRGRAEQ